MAKVTSTNCRDEKILHENGMDPSKYGVIHREDDCIRFLCYKTRDIIQIHRGDRAWS